SADGRYVVFSSTATNLVAGQVDASRTSSVNDDLFLYDRLTGTNTLMSHTATSATTTGNGASYAPVLSADGRYVVFRSLASNLAPAMPDPSNTQDASLSARVTGTIPRVSPTPPPATTAGNSFADHPTISADGRTIAFEGFASNVVAGDVNNAPDIFLLS